MVSIHGLGACLLHLRGKPMGAIPYKERFGGLEGCSEGGLEGVCGAVLRVFVGFGRGGWKHGLTHFGAFF